MTVYLLSKRGTLHKGIQAADGSRQSFEADNLDDAEIEVFAHLSEVPAQRIKRFCKRCYPGNPT